MARLAGAFRRDDRCAAADESVEHDVATRCAVQDGIGDQPYRLNRGVKREEADDDCRAPSRRGRSWAPHSNATRAMTPHSTAAR